MKGPAMKSAHAFSVSIPADNQEQAMAVLYCCGMLGCEEREKDGIITYTAFFPDPFSGHGAMEALRVSAAATAVSPLTTIEPQDWIAVWRASMQPARLADGVWVSPAWLRPALAPDDLWIRIEPKMAFGTGHHATTRLAARAILDSRTSVSGGRFLDIGTGSGVLCFVADHCGALASVGVEVDLDCRENLSENRAGNRCHRPPDFIIGTIDCLDTRHAFTAIAMNMIRTHSEPLLGPCRAMLRPGGALIWSGILIDESGAVIVAAESRGFRLVARMTEAEWWCGVFASLE
jgi:ribosomal protein L11 methyltransferase